VEPGLERLNSLPPHEAEMEFGRCCGATNWAQRMAAARPFSNTSQLFSIADNIWWSLEPADWLEAFASHPRIGETKPALATDAEAQSDTTAAVRAGTPERWSAQEQSALQNASEETVRALADLNREYEKKFGYVYIVCATGRSSDEMLAILQGRLSNDRETELRTAASEQSRITKLRLGKLINQ
jgi:OHCU decarboxylase